MLHQQNKTKLSYIMILNVIIKRMKEEKRIIINPPLTPS